MVVHLSVNSLNVFMMYCNRGQTPDMSFVSGSVRDWKSFRDTACMRSPSVACFPGGHQGGLRETDPRPGAGVFHRQTCGLTQPLCPACRTCRIGSSESFQVWSKIADIPWSWLQEEYGILETTESGSHS